MLNHSFLAFFHLLLIHLLSPDLWLENAGLTGRQGENQLKRCKGTEQSMTT